MDTFLVWRISSHTVVFLKMQPTVRTTQLSRKNQYTARAGSSRRSHLFSTVITSTADKVAPSTVISRLPAMYPRPVSYTHLDVYKRQALDLRVPEQNYFSDVAADAWYADGVNAMAAKGFFAGDGSAFRPEDTITYEEMVTVLSSVAAWASLDGYELAQENLSAGDWGNYYQFSDWAQTSARNLDELGALVGDQQPGDAGTRETAAGLLCALMEATHLIWS